MFAGLLVSILLMVIVSLATQKSCPVPDYILSALEETAKLGPIPKEMLAYADYSLGGEASEISRHIKESLES